MSDDGPRDYRLVVQRLYEREPALAMGRYKPRRWGGLAGLRGWLLLGGGSFSLCPPLGGGWLPAASWAGCDSACLLASQLAHAPGAAA